MPTEVIKSVGPGGTRDYLTLSAWNTAQAKDITSATGTDEIHIAECYGGADVLGTTQLFMNGWVCTDANYVVIRAATGEEHQGTGVFDTAKAYCDNTAPGNQSLFRTFNTLRLRVEGMQIRQNHVNGTAGAKIFFSSNGNSNWQVDRCLLINELPSDGTGCDGCVFEIRVSLDDTFFRNNIMIMNGNGGSGSVQACYTQQGAGTGRVFFYNNTVVLRDRASGNANIYTVRDGNGSSDDYTVQNNYTYKDPNTTGNIYNGIIGSVVLNGANDATSNTEASTVGLRSVAYSTTNFENVTPGSEDLTLKSASVLFNAGADLSGSGVTEDVRGLSRPQGTDFDIGAVELELVLPVFVGGGTMSTTGTMLGTESDCYGIIERSTGVSVPGGLTTTIGQSFTGTGRYLERIRLWAFSQGTGGGGAGQVDIYAHTGTYGTSSEPTGATLGTSTNTIDPTTIDDTLGAIQPIDFLFDGTLLLEKGVNYCLELSGLTGDATNGSTWWIDNSSPTHEGNCFFSTGPESGFDLCFCVYSGIDSVLTSTMEGVSAFYTVPVVTSEMDGVGTMTTTGRAVQKVLVDEYDETNLTTYDILWDGNQGLAQSFEVSNTVKLSVVRFWGVRTGSPAGSLTCELYAHSGTFGTSSVPTGSALATTTKPIPVADLPVNFPGDEVTFPFDGTFDLVAGEKYCIVLSGITGSIGNIFAVGLDNISSAASGNRSSSTTLLSWTPNAAEDFCFSVYGCEAGYFSGVGTMATTGRVLNGLLSVTAADETSASLYLVNQEVSLSTTAIWNTALTAIGVSLVSGTGDGSRQGTLLQSIWDDFRRQFICEHLWAGAKTTATLSTFKDADGTTAVKPTGRWNYAFALPGNSDPLPYLHALYINGRENTPNSSGSNFWEIEVVANDAGTLARCLLTNAATVKLEYIFDSKDDNIELLSPLTRHAMGLALAHHIAPNFGKPAKERELLRARYEDAIMKAKGNNGQESTPPLFQNTPLLDARDGGWF